MNKIEQTIDEVIHKCEEEHGHSFSGGRGLSMFLKITYQSRGRRRVYRSYGNGIVMDEFAAALRERMSSVEIELVEGTLD